MFSVKKSNCLICHLFVGQSNLLKLNIIVHSLRWQLTFWGQHSNQSPSRQKFLYSKPRLYLYISGTSWEKTYRHCLANIQLPPTSTGFPGMNLPELLSGCYCRGLTLETRINHNISIVIIFQDNIKTICQNLSILYKSLNQFCLRIKLRQWLWVFFVFVAYSATL